MQFQQSQRALDVMRSARPEQRRCSRAHLPVQAIASFPNRNGDESQTAFLRDISLLGAFFYCKSRPDIGESAALNFALSDNQMPVHIHCQGTVVRVEENPVQEAAIGVAIQFTDYKVLTPTGDETRTPLSFADSSVDVLERKFARRVEFEKYARRVQGAA